MSIEQENNDMLRNQIKEVDHHSKEIKQVVTKRTRVEPWVVAKMERASSDLSDVTHYLDGEKYADGGSTYADGGNIVTTEYMGYILETNLQPTGAATTLAKKDGEYVFGTFATAHEERTSVEKMQEKIRNAEKGKFADGGRVIGGNVYAYFAYNGDNYQLVESPAMGEPYDGVVKDIITENGKKKYVISFENGETKRVSDGIFNDYIHVYKYDKGGSMYTDGGEIAERFKKAKDETFYYVDYAIHKDGVHRKFFETESEALKFYEEIILHPFSDLASMRRESYNSYGALTESKKLKDYTAPWEKFKRFSDGGSMYAGARGVEDVVVLQDRKYPITYTVKPSGNSWLVVSSSPNWEEDQEMVFISKEDALNHAKIEAGYTKDFDPESAFMRSNERFAKGGNLTALSDIPNLMEEIEAGRVTYRGSSKGYLIKVNGKEYLISSEDLRKLDWDEENMRWKNKIAFSAPFRKYSEGGEIMVGDEFLNTERGEKFYIEKVDTSDKSYPFYVLKSNPNDLPEVIGRNEFERYYKAGLYERLSDEKYAEGGGVSSSNAEKIAKLEKVLSSTLVPDSVKEKARLEIEKLKSEGSSSSKGISAEQADLNKKALAIVEKAKITNYIGLVAEALQDANYSSEGFKFAQLVDSSIKTKEDWYQAEDFTGDDKTRDAAIEIAQMCGWDGDKITEALYFVLKMNGEHRLADAVKKAMAVEEASYPNAITELTKRQTEYTQEIATRTGLRQSAVAEFVAKNGLSESETLAIVSGLGRKQISASDVMTAVVGTPNNEYEQKIVAFAKSGEGFKAVPSKAGEGKVKLKEVVIEWAEGDQSKYDKFPKSYKSWKEASDSVKPIAKDASEFEGYNKVGFTVRWEDGENYKGRLDVSSKVDNPNVEPYIGNVFGVHMKEWIDYMLSDESRQSEDEKKEMREFLEKYDLGLDVKSSEPKSIRSVVETETKPSIRTAVVEVEKEQPKVSDDRLKGKHISDVSQYVPHRNIESITFKHEGKSVTVKGSQIFDGIYVDNKALGIKSKRTPKAKQPKVTRTQFEEESFEYGKGGSANSNSKNWVVIIKYQLKNDIKYFECVVKGKKGACKKAQDLLWEAKANRGSIRIMDCWIDSETNENEGVILKM